MKIVNKIIVGGNLLSMAEVLQESNIGKLYQAEDNPDFLYLVSGSKFGVVYYICFSISDKIIVGNHLTYNADNYTKRRFILASSNPTITIS